MNGKVLTRLLQRSRVNPETGCWEWQGSTGSGYGTINVNGRMRTTHRLMNELMYGQIPEGICICHRCDNRRCINPRHHFRGTLSDNTRDAVNKNRIPMCLTRGSQRTNSRLTEEIVREARIRYANGETQVDLAKEYGVSRTTILAAINGHTWSHVAA